MNFHRIVLIVVSVLLCSCSCGNREVQFTSGTVDSTLFAAGFTVERCEGYTKVSIRDPWDTLRTKQTYLLVPRGSRVPRNLPEGCSLIRVPVQKAIVYAPLHAAVIEQLGCLDCICGICETNYITSPNIYQRVANGSVADLGPSMSPNIEKIIDLDPDIIIASPFENCGFGSAEKLGIPIVEAADYMENHPFGRTEWIKFYGLLFDCAEKADSLFNATIERYNSLKNLAAKAGNRPTVLLERKYGSAWTVPCGGSFIAQMHSDAGANYIFSDIEGTNSKPLSFEAVLERGVEADYWLFKDNTDYTYSSIKRDYPPYANFKAFKDKNIYLCRTVHTTYYDDITIHPDWVLEDFIRIYHPGLLPEGQLRYYCTIDD